MMQACSPSVQNHMTDRETFTDSRGGWRVDTPGIKGVLGPGHRKTDGDASEQEDSNM